MPAVVPSELRQMISVKPLEDGVHNCIEQRESPTVFCPNTTDFGISAQMAYMRARAIMEQGKFPGPWHLEICPTSVCPIDCTFCSYTDRNRIGHTLSDEKLEEVISDALRLEVVGIYFSGGGDPLAKSHIATHIENAARGCGVAIQTNAVALHALLARGETWFNQNIDLVSWSIYANSPILFEAACRGNSTQFRQMENSMRQAVAYRNAWRETHGRESCDLPPTHLSGKIVIGRENYTAIHDLLSFARSFELDTYHIRLVDNYEPGQDVSLTSHEMTSLARLVADNEHDPLLRSFHSSLKLRQEKPTPCPAYSILYGLNAIVETSGEVYLSIPSDGDSRASIGNIWSTPLRDLWGSERHQDVIKSLSLATRPPISKDRHHKLDLAIHDFATGSRQYAMTENLLSDRNFRMYQRSQI